jgi:hypothetical protein
MSIKHASRSGAVYYLHGKQGKGGKPNYFFSKDADGPLVDVVPGGFEIFESIRGQVFLRRIPEKLITDQEVAMTRSALNAHAEEWLHKIEVKKNTIVVHETESGSGLFRELAPWVSPARDKQLRIAHAYYQPVLRFILTDPARRIFEPERFCFRGSVDDWISIGPSALLPALLKKYIKHLGRESMYDLF